MVLHTHHDLAKSYGLCGIHRRDDGSVIGLPKPGEGFTSRSCHDLSGLKAACGNFRAALISPLFPSLSKPGHGPSARITLAELGAFLASRDQRARQTDVFGLGGIDESTLEACYPLGLDGVAVLGAVWLSNDPVAAYRRLLEKIKMHSAETNAAHARAAAV
jgi:thiamine-phosphate pyrophosphorylase